METIQIMAGLADKIEFRGELLSEYKWSLQNLAFSARATAYRTDTGNLVVSVDEWQDEAPAPQSHKFTYAVVPLSAFEAARNRGRLARFFKGDVFTALEDAILPAFPTFNHRPARDFVRVLAAQLGYAPAVTRQV